MLIFTTKKTLLPYLELKTYVYEIEKKMRGYMLLPRNDIEFWYKHNQQVDTLK